MSLHLTFKALYLVFKFSAVVMKIHFGAICANLNYLCCKSSNLIKKKTKKNGNASTNGAFWDEFSKQYQHHSIKKAPYVMAN